MTWAIGDRVQLRPAASWTQPYRGWAERGRGATVRNIFTPTGTDREIVAVMFDRSRKPHILEHFEAHELIKYADQ